MTLNQKARYALFNLISRIRYWWRNIERSTSNPPYHLQEIGYSIGFFYAQKHNMDFVKAAAEVSKLGLYNITMRGDVVVLHTTRPGLWIGRKGENIDALSKHLGKKIDIKEIKFSWQDIITPEDPSQHF